MLKNLFIDGVSVDIDAQYVQLGLLDSKDINPEKIVQVIEDAGYDVNLLFILQNEKLIKFGTDKLGILQPISFNLTSDNNN